MGSFGARSYTSTETRCEMVSQPAAGWTVKLSLECRGAPKRALPNAPTGFVGANREEIMPRNYWASIGVVILIIACVLFWRYVGCF